MPALAGFGNAQKPLNIAKSRQRQKPARPERRDQDGRPALFDPIVYLYPLEVFRGSACKAKIGNRITALLRIFERNLKMTNTINTEKLTALVTAMHNDAVKRLFDSDFGESSKIHGEINAYCKVSHILEDPKMFDLYYDKFCKADEPTETDAPSADETEVLAPADDDDTADDADKDIDYPCQEMVWSKDESELSKEEKTLLRKMRKDMRRNAR